MTDYGVRKAAPLNKPQSLARNPSFLAGTLCLSIFMLGGLIAFLMAISAHTMLLFSPLWFFLVPVPFGTVFAVLADKFRQTLREKTRWTRFSLTSLGISMIVID
jgi:hypothetical protein